MENRAYEVAKWLLNEDGNGSTDVEFAMVFVWYFAMSGKNHLSARDFAEFDVDRAMEYFGDVLKEIIFDQGGPPAWWKDSELFQRIVNERGI